MKNEELEQMIVKSFSAEPDYHLPSDFAEKVTNIISHREQSKGSCQEYFYIAVISIILLAIAPGIYYLFDPEVLLKSFNFIKENIFPVAFIAVILSFILFADRVLLRFLFSRWNRT
jgi:hypothetical protein